MSLLRIIASRYSYIVAKGMISFFFMVAQYPMVSVSVCVCVITHFLHAINLNLTFNKDKKCFIFLWVYQNKTYSSNTMKSSCQHWPLHWGTLHCTVSRIERTVVSLEGGIHPVSGNRRYSVSADCWVCLSLGKSFSFPKESAKSVVWICVIF